MWGDLRPVQLLLAAGADARTVRSSDGAGIMHIAAGKGNAHALDVPNVCPHRSSTPTGGVTHNPATPLRCPQEARETSTTIVQAQHLYLGWVRRRAE